MEEVEHHGVQLVGGVWAAGYDDGIEVLIEDDGNVVQLVGRQVLVFDKASDPGCVTVFGYAVAEGGGGAVEVGGREVAGAGVFGRVFFPEG